MNKKIIFLDYDGVVNNLIFHSVDGEPDFYSKPLEEYSGRDYCVNDMQAVAWLNKICREFNCDVVVTSTWRNRDDYQDCLYNAGFKGKILGRTPLETGLGGHRGLQIQQWRDQHKEYQDLDFIILDDDTDMYPYMKHLIQTDTIRGLGYYEYQKICERWEK